MTCYIQLSRLNCEGGYNILALQVWPVIGDLFGIWGRGKKYYKNRGETYRVKWKREEGRNEYGKGKGQRKILKCDGEG